MNGLSWKMAAMLFKWVLGFFWKSRSWSICVTNMVLVSQNERSLWKFLLSSLYYVLPKPTNNQRWPAVYYVGSKLAWNTSCHLAELSWRWCHSQELAQLKDWRGERNKGPHFTGFPRPGEKARKMVVQGSSARQWTGRWKLT